MTTYFNILAWRIPVMGEPGGLPSMGSHIVGHDWSDFAAAAAAAAACLGYYRFCYYEHKGAWIFSRYSFFFQRYAQDWNCWIVWKLCFYLFWGTVVLFSKWLHQFTLHQQCKRDSLFSTPSPASVIHQVSSDGHSDRYEVVPPCSVDLLSLLISNAEHLFICLFTICVSSFKPQISAVRLTSVDCV